MSNKRDDTKLIRDCLKFERDIIAAEARFTGAPESRAGSLVQSIHDAEERKFHRAHDRAADLLANVIRTRAFTVAGLCAKARLAPVVSECKVDDEGSLLESLAADVLALFGEERTERGAPAVDARQ